MDNKLRAYFSKLGRKAAKKRMETTTAKQRKAQAKKASAARWGKKAGTR
jgi:hypothetical protein